MKEDFGKMIKETDHQYMPTHQGAHSLIVGVCGFCGRKLSAHEFRDIQSLLEFKTSGLCQECQDETFKEGK